VTTRKYGKLPRQIYPYMPDVYETVKRYTRVSPYVVIGEMFGISRQRAQQVVLQEKERQAKEAAVAIADTELP